MTTTAPTTTPTPTLAEIKADPSRVPTATTCGIGDRVLYRVKPDAPAARRHYSQGMTETSTLPLGMMFWWDGETTDGEGDILISGHGWVAQEFVEKIPTYHEKAFPDEFGVGICVDHALHCLDWVGTVNPDCVDCQRLTNQAPQESTDQDGVPTPTAAGPTPGWSYGREFVSDPSNLRLYRVSQNPRTVVSNADRVPPAGVRFLWDGESSDGDGEVSLTHQLPLGNHDRYYVDKACLELVDDEQVSPAGDQGSSTDTAYLQGVIAQLTEERNQAEQLATRLTEERDRATQENTRLQNRFESLGDALYEEAEERGWCSDYEEFVDNHPNMGLKRRVNDYRVTVRVNVEFDISVPERRSVDDAETYVRNMSEGTIRDQLRSRLDGYGSTPDIMDLDIVDTNLDD